MGQQSVAADSADLVFPLSGRSLPLDHAAALLQALTQELPWLASEPLAGVHPLKLVVQGDSACGWLARRTRLWLRLPRPRLAQAGALAGRTLSVDGCALRLETPQLREFLPHGTLYAPAVAAPSDDEAQFDTLVASGLRALGVHAPWVCGRRRMHGGAGALRTSFSLLVHTLSADDSLRLQEQGLGGFRLLGCGVFVPHKSTAAVGSA